MTLIFFDKIQNQKPSFWKTIFYKDEWDVLDGVPWVVPYSRH